MAYVELHAGMPSHPKTTLLVKALKLPRAQVVGHLACLWAWAIGNSPSGIIRREYIEGAAEWEGESGVLLAALLEKRWLEPEGNDCARIHDWEDYTRQYRKARSDYARKKRVVGAEDAPKSAEDAPTTRGGRAEEAVTGTDLNRPEQTRPEQTHTNDVARAKFLNDSLDRLMSAMPEGKRKNRELAAHALTDLQPTPELVAQIEAGIRRLAAEDDEWRRDKVPRLHRILAEKLWVEEPARAAPMKATGTVTASPSTWTPEKAGTREF